MFRVGSHPSDRLFYILVVGIGIVSSAVILAALYFLTAAFDQYAADSNLTLRTVQFGSHFRQIALPWVLFVCAALILLTLWIGAYFRKLLGSLDRMHKVATTDHLTGVANRTALTEMLHTPLVQEALYDGRLAVISLDLDNFKRLNDEYGHQAGDTALRIAAARILHPKRRHDKVYRMGGDEFVCLVFDPEPSVAAQEIVERLRTAFNVPMDLGNVRQIVSPSIGIAVANRGETWDVVLERSDAAMYCAKRKNLANDDDYDHDCRPEALRS